MSEQIPREPTGDECNTNAPLGDGWFAIWYPQMGGYVGKAAVNVANEDGCVEVYVWHDGEFPFRGEDGMSPVLLHHCDMDQFRHFADQVERLQDES